MVTCKGRWAECDPHHQLRRVTQRGPASGSARKWPQTWRSSCLPGTIKAKPLPSISAQIRYERLRPCQPAPALTAAWEDREALKPQHASESFHQASLRVATLLTHSRPRSEDRGPHRTHHNWQDLYKTQRWDGPGIKVLPLSLQLQDLHAGLWRYCTC